MNRPELESVLSALADERFTDWYRENVEALDALDEDMTMAWVARYYLLDVLTGQGVPTSA